MVGFGPEDDHFVAELTYNYGIGDYKLGNDFMVNVILFQPIFVLDLQLASDILTADDFQVLFSDQFNDILYLPNQNQDRGESSNGWSACFCLQESQVQSSALQGLLSTQEQLLKPSVWPQNKLLQGSSYLRASFRMKYAAQVLEIKIKTQRYGPE